MGAPAACRQVFAAEAGGGNQRQDPLLRASEKERPADPKTSGPLKDPGSVLLTHSLAAAVSSALEDLTSVFGMGTGVAPPAWPPGIFTRIRIVSVRSKLELSLTAD